MQSKIQNRLIGFLLIIVTLVLDQGTKFHVITDLMNPPQVIPVTSFFNFTLAWNTGVSFSLFDSYGDLGTQLLLAVAGIISLIFMVWLWRSENRFLSAGLGMVIGGALGNIIDRVRYGAVMDFLDFYYGDYHWPAFNLADTFICVGVLFILIESFLEDKSSQKDTNQKDINQEDTKERKGDKNA